MEWAHLLFLVVVELLMSMSVFYCVEAQAGTTSNSFGYTIRENLKATMSVVLVAFFAAFVFMGIFSHYLYRCSYRYGTNHSPLVAATELCDRGVNRQVIDKCPILVYSAVKDLKMGGSALECAVCLSEFQDYDNIRLLPKCHHVFHPDCIDEWLLPHMTCPVCRTTLSSDVSDINTATRTRTTSASNTAETEQQQQQQHHVVCDDVATGQGGESDITVVVPPCEWRMLDKFPRSHSTGHSPVELPEVVDRYTLRLPDHVRRQVLASHGRVLSSAPSSDVVLPAGVWSSKRVCYRGESNNVAVSMTPPPFVSGGIWGMGSYANDDNWASEARGGGGGGVEVHVRRCWTPLRISFSRVEEGAQKPAHHTRPESNDNQ